MKEPHIIVQFVGFQSNNSAREYTFTVREPATEPREYTIAIPNEAFNSHRVRYQDAPDICSHKLHRELAALKVQVRGEQLEHRTGRAGQSP